MDHMYDRLIHMFLAGWCGEAAGARLEFQQRRFTREEVDAAMHFSTHINGRGAEEGEEGAKEEENTTVVGLELGQGQITDDTEMELCLLSALIDGRESGDEYFPLERIAANYIEWYRSNPFDIGQTVLHAVLGAESADDMLTNAHEYNTQSEANGSLMRCAPLAAMFFAKEKETEQQKETNKTEQEQDDQETNDLLVELAMLESELTHPHPVVGAITGIYCILLLSLLRDMPVSSILTMIHPFIFRHALIQAWFDTAIHMNPSEMAEYNCLKQEGHVKHAFIMVIHYLLHLDHYSYEEAIRQVIKSGGDTDTNAKIVGNLFGAYSLSSQIPNYMSSIVLSFDPTTHHHPFFRRPPIYSIQHGISLIRKLCSF